MDDICPPTPTQMAQMNEMEAKFAQTTTENTLLDNMIIECLSQGNMSTPSMAKLIHCLACLYVRNLSSSTSNSAQAAPAAADEGQEALFSEAVRHLTAILHQVTETEIINAIEQNPERDYLANFFIQSIEKEMALSSDDLSDKGSAAFDFILKCSEVMNLDSAAVPGGVAGSSSEESGASSSQSRNHTRQSDMVSRHLTSIAEEMNGPSFGDGRAPSSQLRVPTYQQDAVNDQLPTVAAEMNGPVVAFEANDVPPPRVRVNINGSTRARRRREREREAAAMAP